MLGVGIVSKITVADGVGVIRLTPLERIAFGRTFISFETARVVGAYLEATPKRRELGVRVSRNGLFWPKVGEYALDSKRVMYLSSRKKSCIRLLFLNPAFDELYLSLQDFEVLAPAIKSQVPRLDLIQ